MKRISTILVFLFFLPAALAAQKVISIKIDGAINPVTAEFIHRSLQVARTEKAECLLIHLNTPGGLLESTRKIVSDILESPVPVVVYVSPAGSRAASAGVFITLSADIAAMSPGTNIGAAHPVALQGGMDSTMSEKATNDAAAFIRAIAEKRKRNLAWAEEAVRQSISITENEALQKNVIDLVAKNTTELLSDIDGKSIELNTGTVTLHTRNAQVETVNMKSSEELLDLLSDPNIAYVLLLLGIFGILFEFYNPGAIFPGIIGVISLILSFYSMSALPINYAGLALLIFSIILFLLELKIASHGLLAIGGIVSLLLGSIMLIRPESTLDVIGISRSVIVTAVIVTALFFFFVIGIGLKAQKRRPVTGVEGIMEETGESLEILDPTGTVRIHGEIWNAESVGGKINKGEKVQVTAMKDLKLYVKLR